ncbi:MAG: hypothetical protein E7338_00955 [Clostridiales bacterium]|nr:hypothetical protein [Clostridiales bacterium]
MTSIENSALPMMIIYLIASTIVIGYNAYIEIVFRLRRKISYKNYKFFEPFYLLKLNIYNIVAMGVVAFLSIILFALYIWSNVVRIYCIVFIPMILSMSLFIYYEFSRLNYNNEDIITFDPYFRDLYKIERSKTAILNKISIVETDFNKLSSELMAKFKAFNTLLPNKEKEQEFQAFIDKCNKEFEKNRGELVNYNKSVISQFDNSLNDFLTLGLATDYEIPEFHTIDVQQMFGYITELRTMFETYVSQQAKQKLRQGALKSPDKIIEVFNIALKMNVRFTDEDIMAILEALNSKVAKKEEVFTYLLSQNLVSEDVLHEAIVRRDWAWCVIEDNVFAKSRKKIIELYSDIVEHNAINCCNKLLNMNAVDQSDILVKVLNTATKSNACTQVIKFRIIIQSNDQEFDDEATMYENMAISIRNYVLENPSDENRAWIIDVCNASSFYQNKEQIVNIYTRISQKIKDKYNYLNSVLICFYEGELSTNKYIDNTKITNFYLENILTLNNSTLKVFALLACALILLVDEDDKNVQVAIDGIKHDQIGRDALQNTQTDVEAGKYIVKTLLKTKLDKVIPIVNRVEVKRMSLNKIKELAK